MISDRESMTLEPGLWRSVRTVVRASLSAVVGIALCSCAAITDPYVSPTSNDIRNRNDFDEASNYAAGKVGELHTKLTELNAYDVGTGSIISVAGIAGIGMGAFGAHADALMTAGLGGGAAYGARAYLPIQDRRQIYEKAASVIMCSIAEYTFVDLSPAIKDIENAARELECTATAIQDALLHILQQSGGKAPKSVNGNSDCPSRNGASIADGYLQHYSEQTRWREAQESVDLTHKRAQSFTNAADEFKASRGRMLVATTDAILLSVTEQLNAAALDPDGAVKALRSTTTSFTKSLNDAYKGLRSAAEPTKEKTEAARDNASDARAAAAATAQSDNDPKKTSAHEAVNTAEKTTQQVDRIVSSADRIWKIVNPDSKCAAQP